MPNTTDEGPRYAIYFAPAADSDLYRFGSATLAYDSYTGRDVPVPSWLGVDAEVWRELTEEPRRYGFHATLKAPFRLAAARREADLVQAFFDFAGRRRAIATIAPQVRLLGAFTAIVPQESSVPLSDLANTCTAEFDGFRAPMSQHERERRTRAPLSAREIGNLDRWGYPYVFEDFRFHMTLTGPLPAEHREAVPAMLREAFRRACGEGPIAIDCIGLFKQDDARARFRVLHHAELNFE
jgi:putative phosphonate metabolism protein